MAGIRNPVALDVLKAVSDGVDTLQYAWGDAVYQGGGQFAWPPLLVSTSPGCFGRRQASEPACRARCEAVGMILPAGATRCSALSTVPRVPFRQHQLTRHGSHH